MRIKKERSLNTSSTRKLRRARRLYVRICLPSIFQYGNDAIDIMVKNAQERGLWSQGTHPRCVRQSIQSHMFRIECPGETYQTWHQYCFRWGLDTGTGYFKPIKEMSNVY